MKPTHEVGQPFGAARAALTGLTPDAAAALLVAASDVALLVDREGVIRDVTAPHADAAFARASEWVGRLWVDVVTRETRPKVDLLMRDVAASGVSVRRQLNHVSADGADIPVAYVAVRVSAKGDVVAVGRDQRPLAQLQHRLVETQQAMERDYWRMRHIETRYRLLFQLSTEAVLVVDAAARKVVDANTAAGELFEMPAARLVGRPFPGTLAPDAAAQLDELLASTRLQGTADEMEIPLREGRTVRVSASSFRQDAETLFLVRFAGTAAAAPPERAGQSSVLDLIAKAPDGFVVTDLDGRVLTANRAFLDIAQLATEDQAKGRLLGDWLGRPGADLPVLLSMLKKHGAVRVVATAARGEHGAVGEVEVSAVWAPDATPPTVGFVVRDIGRRVAAGPQGARDLTRAVEQLTGLVGRVSLPELLRDTVELVERHFVEAALELTNDNRTAAAEVLGLSRQSLYMKLRRHSLLVGADEREQAS